MPDRHNIPIEDHHEDIIGKVIRGKKLKLPAIAAAAGISTDQANALLNGEVDEPAIRALATQLDLDPNALVISANKIWRPQEVDLADGLAMFNTEWHDMRVNAFVVWDPQTKDAAIFDSGADATTMIEFIEKEGLVVLSIYLTHTHPDHIADLPRLQNEFPGATTYVHRLEKEK
ncbi:MAG: hydroxyacylglutathione hydrolase, partial [Verrucomicrobiales bacterium]